MTVPWYHMVYVHWGSAGNWTQVGTRKAEADNHNVGKPTRGGRVLTELVKNDINDKVHGS